MPATERITLAEVRAHLSPHIKADPSVRWFGRPLGNLLTPLFHNRGWTANEVTVARTMLAFGGVALLAVPDARWWPVSAIVYYACFVLDCVDGNLARMQRSVTYLGKFLDGLADSVYPYLATFLVGIGCAARFESPWLMVLGGAISIISVTNQMLRSRLSFMREWMVSLSGPLTDAELASAANARKMQSSVSALLVNGYFVAVAALLWPEWGGPLFLALTLVVQLIPDLIWSGATVVEANALLRRPRQSKHSRPTA